MTISLVRHAKAGERGSWVDDLHRPLSEAGWKQARRVARRLADHGPTLLVSSPYVRCVQTLEPLADRIGTTVTVDDRLAEGSPFEDALDLLLDVPDRAVLCSHGDVIPEVIQALVRRGLDLRSEPDWRKGTVWRLHRTSRGNFTRATVWAPPVKTRVP